MLLGVDCYSPGRWSASQMADGPQFIWTPHTERPSFCALLVFKGGLYAPKDRMIRSSFWTTIRSQNQFCSSSNETMADRPPPRSGPSTGLFPAEIYLGKTLITLSSNVQIRCLDSMESLFRGIHNPTEYLIQNTMDQSSISLQEPI